MDAYGHVNNVIFLGYLEEARVSLFERMDLANPLETGVVVARHEIDYRKPLVYRAGARLSGHLGRECPASFVDLPTRHPRRCRHRLRAGHDRHGRLGHRGADVARAQRGRTAQLLSLTDDPPGL